MLPFVASLLVLWLGIAALVLDLGLATATQARMQMAADVAALSGVARPDGSPASDAAARDRARDLAARAWQDPGGAAPRALVVQPFDPRGGRAAALESATPAGVRGDPPRLPADFDLPANPLTLQRNPANDPHGDLVRGRFQAGAADAGDHLADPARRYRRDDFVADATGHDLLVRVRAVPAELDPLASDPPASSSLRPASLVFGQATFAAFQDPDAGYSMRHHGVPIRATSIAAARPALSVGLAVGGSSASGAGGAAAPTLPGLAPFALALDDWRALLALGGSSALVASSGALVLALPDGAVRPLLRVSRSGVDTVGNDVGEVLPGDLALAGDAPPALPLAYLPLVDTRSGSARVAAFAPVRFETAGSGAVLLVFEDAHTVAPGNASARASAPGADLAALRACEADDAGCGRSLLRAPALVR